MVCLQCSAFSLFSKFHETESAQKFSNKQHGEVSEQNLQGVHNLLIVYVVTPKTMRCLGPAKNVFEILLELACEPTVVTNMQGAPQIFVRVANVQSYRVTRWQNKHVNKNRFVTRHTRQCQISFSTLLAAAFWTAIIFSSKMAGTLCEDNKCSLHSQAFIRVAAAGAAYFLF